MFSFFKKKTQVRYCCSCDCADDFGGIVMGSEASCLIFVSF